MEKYQMISKVLEDGTIQHTFTDDPKWIGIQQPNTPMAKTKWTNLKWKANNEK